MNRTANERLKCILDAARKHSKSKSTTVWVLGSDDARCKFFCTANPEIRDEIILENEYSVIATFENGEEVKE